MFVFEEKLKEISAAGIDTVHVHVAIDEKTKSPLS